MVSLFADIRADVERKYRLRTVYSRLYFGYHVDEDLIRDVIVAGFVVVKVLRYDGDFLCCSL